MKEKTCAEIIAESQDRINNSPVLKAACAYSDSAKKPTTIYGYGKLGLIEAFQAGAEWQSKQSPWISVEDKLPPMAEHVILKKGTFYVGFGFFGENMIFHSITIGDNSLVPNTVSFTHWMPITE